MHEVFSRHLHATYRGLEHACGESRRAWIGCIQNLEVMLGQRQEESDPATSPRRCSSANHTTDNRVIMQVLLVKFTNIHNHDITIPILTCHPESVVQTTQASTPEGATIVAPNNTSARRQSRLLSGSRTWTHVVPSNEGCCSPRL